MAGIIFTKGVTVKAGEAPGKPFELSAAALERILSGAGSSPVSTWDEVRGIPGGGGKYVASGAYCNCTGGTCGTTSAGTMSVAMDINFAAKAIGGGSSSISLPGASGASGSIQSLSFANLGGDAKATLTVSGSGDFSGTGVKLLTSGGAVADSASFDVRAIYASGPDPTQTFGGELTAPFAP